MSMGLLQRLLGKREPEAQMFARETKRVEKLAMDAVIAAERKLGHEPQDVSHLKCGYDIESRIPETGKLRFIEVKGRIKQAETITVTKNEIMTALNKLNDYILALVEVPPSKEFGENDAWKAKEHSSSYIVDDGCKIFYIKQAFQKEPDFDVTSVNYNLRELRERSQKPA